MIALVLVAALNCGGSIEPMVTDGCYADLADQRVQISNQGESSIVLYDGYQESAALRHRMSAQSVSASFAHAGSAALRAWIKATRRNP